MTDAFALLMTKRPHEQSAKGPARAIKPKYSEYVGQAPPDVLDCASLTTALAHLESADPQLRELIARRPRHADAHAYLGMALHEQDGARRVVAT